MSLAAVIYYIRDDAAPLAVKQCPPGKPALGHWSLT